MLQSGGGGGDVGDTAGKRVVTPGSGVIKLWETVTGHRLEPATFDAKSANATAQQLAKFTVADLMHSATAFLGDAEPDLERWLGGVNRVVIARQTATRARQKANVSKR